MCLPSRNPMYFNERRERRTREDGSRGLVHPSVSCVLLLVGGISPEVTQTSHDKNASTLEYYTENSGSQRLKVGRRRWPLFSVMLCTTLKPCPTRQQHPKDDWLNHPKCFNSHCVFKTVCRSGKRVKYIIKSVSMDMCFL